MGMVRVRFVGGPAHDLVRELPAEPDGAPPHRWILRHPDEAPPPGGGGPDHLYQRDHRDGYGTWTMRFVRTDPLGATE
ncbi:hypothetical protein DLJ46_31630 [Micromonospora globispora]|uniref:Uncharacterized protein n=2 Tax=Micromonospora globispora TaxID=1450148 RepID=A0A317JWD4_9ACTN|nr:hypothetical protein DLJ46_31630 [Micromonospora globispora]RQW84432.1 hypothetical protein DKL51_30105 [Micromonospora globispora]